MLHFPRSLASELATAFAADHPPGSTEWSLDSIADDPGDGHLLAVFRGSDRKWLTLALYPTDFDPVSDVPNSSALSDLAWYIVVLADEHIFSRSQSEFPHDTVFRLKHQGRRNELSEYGPRS